MANESAERAKGTEAEAEQAKELALSIAVAALEKKAEDPAVLDARGLAGYADFFVLLSGSSDRQVLAIAEEVERFVKAGGRRPLGTEGADRARWVLIDLGDIVVHVFHEDARIFYDLDGLWADAIRIPVPGAPPRRAF